MAFPLNQNFGVSIPKNIQNAGNTYGPQAFGSGFDASRISGLSFNSNVKVTAGLPNISKPQDYSPKGTKLPEAPVSKQDVIKGINKSSDQQIAKAVGGMVTRDGSILTYDIGTGIGVAKAGTVRDALKNDAGKIKDNINKSFNTDKMTKDVGNVADQKSRSTFPGNRVGTGGGREMPVANPEFGGNGANVRQAFDARANASAIADKAPISNRLMAPATTPTAVAIAKSAPAAAPAPKPAPPPPAKAAAPAPAPKAAAPAPKAAAPAPAPAPKPAPPAPPAPKPAPPPPAKSSGGGGKKK